jgi:hypothetical protein
LPTGCIDAIVQGSLFGISGAFPPVCTQALMVGMGIAGVIAAIGRIATKLHMPSTASGLRWSCAVFFVLSAVYAIVCVISFSVLYRHAIYKRYMSKVIDQQQQSVASLTSEPCNVSVEQAIESSSTASSSTETGRSDYEMVQLDSASTINNNSSSNNNNNNSSNNNSNNNSESVNSSDAPPLDDSEAAAATSSKRLNKLKYQAVAATAIDEQQAVASSTDESSSSIDVGAGVDDGATGGAYMALIKLMRTVLPLPFVLFFVTLALFPGLASEIPSSNNYGSWMPVIIVTLFNVFDFVGRFITRWHWANRLRFKWLWTGSLARLVFIPLLILCVKPRWIDNDMIAFAIVSVFAFSVGYLGGISMMLGPQRVPEQYRERAGTLMICSLLLGLTAGASFSFLLLAWL